ncbi:hypothetical protein ACVSQB_01980 [Bradyrhizobium elkanii]
MTEPRTLFRESGSRKIYFEDITDLQVLALDRGVAAEFAQKQIWEFKNFIVTKETATANIKAAAPKQPVAAVAAPRPAAAASGTTSPAQDREQARQESLAAGIIETQRRMASGQLSASQPARTPEQLGSSIVAQYLAHRDGQSSAAAPRTAEEKLADSIVAQYRAAGANDDGDAEELASSIIGTYRSVRHISGE